MDFKRSASTRNHDKYVKAAQSYTDNPEMTQVAAVESVGLTPNQFNIGKMKEHVDPKVLESKTKRSDVDPNDLAKAAKYYEENQVSQKAALEQFGIKGNQFNAGKMMKLVDPAIAEERKVNRAQINQDIVNSATIWLDDETMTMADAFRATGATDNQHNRKKFKVYARAIDKMRRDAAAKAEAEGDK